MSCVIMVPTEFCGLELRDCFVKGGVNLGFVETLFCNYVQNINQNYIKVYIF